MHNKYKGDDPKKLQQKIDRLQKQVKAHEAKEKKALAGGAKDEDYEMEDKTQHHGCLYTGAQELQRGKSGFNISHLNNSKAKNGKYTFKEKSKAEEYKAKFHPKQGTQILQERSYFLRFNGEINEFEKLILQDVDEWKSTRGVLQQIAKGESFKAITKEKVSEYKQNRLLPQGQIGNQASALTYKELTGRFASTAHRLLGNNENAKAMWRTSSVFCWTRFGDPLFIMNFRFTGPQSDAMRDVFDAVKSCDCRLENISGKFREDDIAEIEPTKSKESKNERPKQKTKAKMTQVIRVFNEGSQRGHQYTKQLSEGEQMNYKLRSAAIARAKAYLTTANDPKKSWSGWTHTLSYKWKTTSPDKKGKQPKVKEKPSGFKQNRKARSGNKD